MKDLVLLVVDDDPLIIQAIKSAIQEPWQVWSARSASQLPERGYHAALVDMHLTDQVGRAEGLEVIRKLNQRQSRLEIVAMSGNLDRTLMEQCLRLGASRFLAKPLHLEELRLTLNKIEALFLLQGATSRRPGLTQWIGSGPKSIELKRQIAQMRNESGPILIEGESGTGKEITAQLIHAQESGGPFVPINVASVPEDLFESEFFGHVKGAFTGADQNKMGLAEAADGGDLFLDEIEAMSLPHQAKLLRFLETGELRRLGSHELLHVQTRVIAATNQDLHHLCKEGLFRQDLLWRLTAKKIQLPRLRDRREDLPELIQHFLTQDKFRRRDLGADALEALVQHTWPGNVRELKRTCEQLILMAPLPVIRREDVLRVINPAIQASVNRPEIDLSAGLAGAVQAFEAQVILQVLADHDDIDQAARVLQISRSSLYKKIKDHNIQWRSDS